MQIMGKASFNCHMARQKSRGFFLLPRKKFKCRAREEKLCLTLAFLNIEIMDKG